MMITMEEAQRRLEEDEGYRKIVKMISEGSNEDYGMQCFRAELHEKSGLDEDQIKVLECGIRWAVEARRKERGEEKRRQEQEEQLWQAEQGQTTEQEQGKQGKQVRFGEEQQLGKTEAENAGEPEVMGRTTEVRTGRRHAGLVPGRDDSRGLNETSRKGRGKGNGGKGEHEGKGGGFGRKGFQQSVRENEEEWGRVAPNMWAGGSHPQATSDLERKKRGGKRHEC